MFTGIVEGLGRIVEIRSSHQGKQFSLEAGFDIGEMKIGDSIAVNGACLTAVDINGRRFKVDASPETMTKTTLGLRKIGDQVNLERALRFSDRLDGHLVSGHVDGIGTISQRRQQGNAILMTVEVNEDLSRYIIPKGSVALDGISLTVNTCDRIRFEVSIIPHTAKETTVSRLKTGDAVNIETDMIGKYVERFVTKTADEARQSEKNTQMDLSFLAKTGFL